MFLLDAVAIAKEVNVLLKLLADKSPKYKQLSVELDKVSQEDVSSFRWGSRMLKWRSSKKDLGIYAEAIYGMLKFLDKKSGKELMTNKEYKHLSNELVETADDARMNIMVSLANGKQFMELEELKELAVATKDELVKKGLIMAYEFSSLDEMKKELDHVIAAGELEIIKRTISVPKWPENKDELIDGYNDTWQCFNSAHSPRQVTRKAWKVARVQVRNGIFYPIEKYVMPE